LKIVIGTLCEEALETLQSNPSPLSVYLFFDQEDPNRQNFQTGLVNWICCAGHVSSLLVFPVSAVALNLQDPDLVPICMMIFLKCMLGKS
jgi:hypothetical protein